eukprot:UN29574
MKYHLFRKSSQKNKKLNNHNKQRDSFDDGHTSVNRTSSKLKILDELVDVYFTQFLEIFQNKIKQKNNLDDGEVLANRIIPPKPQILEPVDAHISEISQTKEEVLANPTSSNLQEKDRQTNDESTVQRHMEVKQECLEEYVENLMSIDNQEIRERAEAMKNYHFSKLRGLHLTQQSEESIIFGVGSGTTGTLSLAKGLYDLGLNVGHWIYNDWPQSARQWERDIWKPSQEKLQPGELEQCHEIYNNLDFRFLYQLMQL